jgi:hypothetical protein
MIDDKRYKWQVVLTQDGIPLNLKLSAINLSTPILNTGNARHKLDNIFFIELKSKTFTLK